MKSLERLGKRVRALRRAKSLTIAQLAENCELSNNFVALIERGRKTPSIETLDKLADALDVQLSELFAFDAPAKATSDQERVVKKILKLNGKRDLVLVAELIDRLLRR